MNDLLSLLPDNLEQLADRAAEYQSAAPFPHISFDDFLPPAVADRALVDFPDPSSGIWHRFEQKGLEYLKLACGDESKIPSGIRNVLYALNTGRFLTFLEKLTGIPKLLPDPYFEGGGMHQTMPGGMLGMHLDFNFNKRLAVYRRLNLLIYLNHDWRDDYGGHFNLSETKNGSPVLSLLPVFNRAALFSTSKRSWHGQPGEVACPAGMSRKSLALYYYTVEPADADDTDMRNTVFAADKKSFVRQFLPPIVMDAVRQLRSR